MGIIGACLPILRQPLKKLLPKVFGSKNATRGYYYSDDRFADQYALRNVAAKKPNDASWHTASISGPEVFNRSGRRESDELEMIGERAEIDKQSEASGDGKVDEGIRRFTTVTVDRRRI